MGQTHAISTAAIALGVAAPLAAASGHTLGVAGTVAFAGVAGGFGVLPDLDHPGATLARVLGPVTKKLSQAVHHLSGGHRKGTHTIWFAAAMTLLAGALISAFGVWAEAPIVFIGSFLTLMLLRLAPRRGGGFGELGYAIEAGAATWAVIHYVDSLWWVPVAVGVGVIGHIIGDIITTAGVPVLYPLLPNMKVRLPILGRTGSGREHAFGVLCSIAAVWMVVAAVSGADWWTSPATWMAAR